jgi:hypothetical protein
MRSPATTIMTFATATAAREQNPALASDLTIRNAAYSRSSKCRTEDELLDRLRRIEQKQEALDVVRAELKAMISQRPLNEIWRKFTSSGGVTASDFAQFLHGQLRPRIIRGHRHLRLVADRRQAMTSRSKDEGPQVAWKQKWCVSPTINISSAESVGA